MVRTVSVLRVRPQYIYTIKIGLCHVKFSTVVALPSPDGGITLLLAAELLRASGLLANSRDRVFRWAVVVRAFGAREVLF